MPVLSPKYPQYPQYPQYPPLTRSKCWGATPDPPAPPSPGVLHMMDNALCIHVYIFWAFYGISAVTVVWQFVMIGRQWYAREGAGRPLMDRACVFSNFIKGHAMRDIVPLVPTSVT